MLKSMTGFGAARRDAEGYHIVAEVKAVNGRFLKTSIKAPAGLSGLEAELEALVKAQLRRGSVSLTVFLKRSGPEALVTVNEPVVRAYQEVFRRLGMAHEPIAMLPGVLGTAGSSEGEALSEAVTGAAKATVDAALRALVEMRQREGAALVGLLEEMCQRLDTLRLQIRAHAPRVVGEYQERLRQRVTTLLQGVDVPVDPQHLAREVALHADRSDITEEVDRLGAHLEQVRTLLRQDSEVGRTLDFLAQEMHREINTMGSKSADAEISRWVVELKSEVERFKEQVANVE